MPGPRSLTPPAPRGLAVPAARQAGPTARPVSAALCIAALVMTTLCPLTAAAADTLTLQGALRTTGGGPVPDGKYGVAVALYADAAGQSKLFEQPFLGVPVAAGRFVVKLGDGIGGNGFDALAIAAGDVYVGVSVDGEPELPLAHIEPLLRAWRASLADNASQAAVALNALQADHATSADAAITATKADSAASAEELDCTGCVTMKELGDDVTAAFVATSGGTITGPLTASGGLDLQDSLLEGARLADLDIANTPCTPALRGRVALGTGTSALYFCAAGQWRKVAGCQGICAAAASVACGDPVVDDCGEVCEGQAGVFCPAGATCVGGTQCQLPGTEALPGTSCKAILNANAAASDGVYWLDLDGDGGAGPFQAYCDMTTDGGGWTVLARFAFADGPNIVSGNLARDGAAMQTDYNLSNAAAASHWHDPNRFLDAGALDAQSEFAVKSGAKVLVGDGFAWLSAPVKEGIPHHTRYGAVNLDGQAYTIASACYDGCCGSHTHSWDTLALIRSYAYNSGDINGNTNSPFVGWGDHRCDIDGYDTTPAWQMVQGGKGDAAQQFDADLVWMFR